VGGLPLTNHPCEPQRRYGARVALGTPRQLRAGCGGHIGERRPLLPLLLLRRRRRWLLLPLLPLLQLLPLLLQRRRWLLLRRWLHAVLRSTVLLRV